MYYLTPERAGDRIPLDSLPVLGTVIFFPLGIKFSRVSGTCTESECGKRVELGQSRHSLPVSWYPGQGLHPLRDPSASLGTHTHTHTGPTVFSVILKKMKPETLVSSGIFISAPLPSVEIKKTVFCAEVLADPWEASASPTGCLEANLSTAHWAEGPHSMSTFQKSFPLPFQGKQ